MKRSTVLLLVAVLLFSFVIPVSAANDEVVYVRDGGTGDGSSEMSPVGTLDDAYRILLNKSDIKNDPDAVGVIVICGTLSVTDHFNYDGGSSHKGRVIYTSLHGGEDFRETEGARLVIHAASKASLSVNDEHRFVLGGPTYMEDIVIDRGGKTDASLTIYASTELYMAESVEVINTNWSRSYTEPRRALTETEIDSIILSAHRGYQPMGPENSIISFEAAGKLGFGYIETDVIMTADGELVCIHDATVDRTTNGSGKVSGMTYAELRALTIDTAAYGFNIASADKAKLYIPTFREYLEICKKYGAKPFIEIKDSGEKTIHKIIDTALEYFAAEDIVMSCGSLSALETSYKYNRDIFHHLIWGVQSDQGYQNSIKALSKMTNSRGEVYAGIAFNISGLADKENYDRAKLWIDKAHKAGLLACLRGADDMTELRLMFELGIDYYPTNVTSPEMLTELLDAVEGGFTYSSADGGKLFIRGGRRSEVTEEAISITLLGGIYDFVAPSNAEAASTGNYSVTVGGNAFVSRLVAGETAQIATGDRQLSRVTVKDNAEIRELYIAGDYANTENVEISISGGKVISLIESRGKRGTAENLTVILADASLMPQNLSISNRAVITGERILEISGEGEYDADVWDRIIMLTDGTTESENDITVESQNESAPPSTAVADSNNEDNGKPSTIVMPVVLIVAFAVIVITIVIVKRNDDLAER